MSYIYNPNVIVLITTDYANMLEQINLTREEQAAVIGFIKHMKEINGKEIEIINGATNYVKCINAINSTWNTIEKAASDYNNAAERAR